MAITITRTGDRSYWAEITPPHSKTCWRAPAPMQLRELIAELEHRGCHRQDIGDALYEVDPDWPARLD